LRIFRIRAIMQANDKKDSLYTQAHLIVAAIRVFEHKNSRPPTIEDLCQTINFSIEKGNFICRKLEELDVIEAVEGSYGTRLFVRDHLNIEHIPRAEPENHFEDELKKFQDNRKAFSQKIETFQAQQKQRKKDLFAEMEKKLKEEMDKK
jgi:hypothetical protein